MGSSVCQVRIPAKYSATVPVTYTLGSSVYRLRNKAWLRCKVPLPLIYKHRKRAASRSLSSRFTLSLVVPAAPLNKTALRRTRSRLCNIFTSTWSGSLAQAHVIKSRVNFWEQIPWKLMMRERVRESTSLSCTCLLRNASYLGIDTRPQKMFQTITQIEKFLKTLAVLTLEKIDLLIWFKVWQYDIEGELALWHRIKRTAMKLGDVGGRICFLTCTRHYFGS